MSSSRRWRQGAGVGLLGLLPTVIACGGGTDREARVADPAFPREVHGAFLGLFAEAAGDVPTPRPGPTPAFRYVGTATVSPETAEQIFIDTSTTVVAPTDAELFLFFDVTAFGPFDRLELRAQVRGHGDHLRRIVAEARGELVLPARLELGIGLADAVGLGTFDLDLTFASTSTDSPEIAVAPPTALRFRLKSPDPNAQTGLPSGYQSAFASCAESQTVPVDPTDAGRVTGFAFNAARGLCFFLQDGFRFDCDRCDDAGVNACSIRACADPPL